MMCAIRIGKDYEHMMTVSELKEFIKELGADPKPFMRKIDLARRIGRHFCVGDVWDKDGIDWGQKPDGKVLWAAMKAMCPTIKKREAKWINERVLPYLYKLEKLERLDEAVDDFWNWAQCFCEDEPNGKLQEKIKNL